jgi:hypothetical protein
MVERVNGELALAGRIRVSSQWAADSLASGGVPAARLTCLQQPVDLNRYRCGPVIESSTGPLRVCCVGSLDLRKGFVYLLRAIRILGDHVPISLRLVGATGDRCSRILLERERQASNVTVRPGDPRDALAESEIFALATLEDGSPFAVAEAMACARAVITTTSTGAAEWVEPGNTGWLVKPASSEHLAEALAAAADARRRLRQMGELARTQTERRAGPGCDSRGRRLGSGMVDHTRETSVRSHRGGGLSGPARHNGAMALRESREPATGRRRRRLHARDGDRSGRYWPPGSCLVSRARRCDGRRERAFRWKAAMPRAISALSVERSTRARRHDDSSCSGSPTASATSR